MATKRGKRKFKLETTTGSDAMDEVMCQRAEIIAEWAIKKDIDWTRLTLAILTQMVAAYKTGYNMKKYGH